MVDGFAEEGCWCAAAEAAPDGGYLEGLAVHCWGTVCSLVVGRWWPSGSRIGGSSCLFQFGWAVEKDGLELKMLIGGCDWRVLVVVEQFGDPCVC